MDNESIPNGMKRNLRTLENPFIHVAGDKETWDYSGKHQVIQRNYHIVDEKPRWIKSIVIWDGTYKRK